MSPVVAAPVDPLAPPGGLDLMPVQQQQQPGGGQVSLSVLIEMMVQKIYHELTILAELLPRKTDMERKIEIFNFSSRTRMLFVRLLALVKWASSAGKVEKCSNIVMFLEKQSTMFMETANNLALNHPGNSHHPGGEEEHPAQTEPGDREQAGEHPHPPADEEPGGG